MVERGIFKNVPQATWRLAIDHIDAWIDHEAERGRTEEAEQQAEIDKMLAAAEAEDAMFEQPTEEDPEEETIG